MAVQAVTQKTYLKLLQESMFEAGVQQRTPTDIDAATGLVPGFKKWVNDSWVELQSERYWDWRKEQTELVIATGMDKFDIRSILSAASLSFQSDASDCEFVLIRELDTTEVTVADLVFTGSSGSTTTITSAGAGLPSVDADEHFYVSGADTSGNDGAYRATGSPSTSSISATKVSGSPADDSAASTVVEHATGEGTQSDEDQGQLWFVHYDDWRGYNERLVDKTAATPDCFTVDHDGVILLNVDTDAFYGIDLDYFSQITEMTAGTDTPTGLPTDYQDILVWDAVMRYGGYDLTNSVVARAAHMHRRLKKRMDVKYLREMRMVPRSLYR